MVNVLISNINFLIYADRMRSAHALVFQLIGGNFKIFSPWASLYSDVVKFVVEELTHPKFLPQSVQGWGVDPKPENFPNF